MDKFENQQNRVLEQKLNIKQPSNESQNFANNAAGGFPTNIEDAKTAISGLVNGGNPTQSLGNLASADATKGILGNPTGSANPEAVAQARKKLHILKRIEYELVEKQNKLKALKNPSPDQKTQLAKVNSELEDLRKDIDSLKATYPEAFNKTKNSSAAGGKSKTKKPKEKSIEDIIEESILAHRLEDVASICEDMIDEGATKWDSIGLVRTSKPGKFLNLMNSFEPAEMEKLLTFNTLQLSNLVPVIRIVKCFTDISTKETVEVDLPLEDYTLPNNIENIFKTREGRGGGVGLEYIELDSQGQQPATKLSFIAKMSLVFQDIKEIDKVRNTIIKTSLVNVAAGAYDPGFAEQGKRYEVSFVDLIHTKPMEKNGKLLDPTSNEYYDKKIRRTLKLIVGWASSDKINKDDSAYIDLNYLPTTTYNLITRKSTFTFEKDGKVKVDLEANAFIESLMLDRTQSDILSFHKLIASKLDRQSNTISILKNKKEKYKEKLKSAKTNKGKKWLEREITKIEEKLKQTEETTKFNVKSEILASFMAHLSDVNDPKIFYYYISPKEMQRLRNLKAISKSEDMSNLYSQENNKQKDLRHIQQILEDRAEAKKTDKKRASLNQKTFAKLGKSGSYQKVTKTKDSIKREVTSDSIISSIKKNIKYLKENRNKSGTIVPYVYMGDIVNYFVNKYCFIEATDGIPPPAGAKFLDENRSTRVILTDFSFSDYGNPQVLATHGEIWSSPEQLEGTADKSASTTTKLTPAKKVINIGSIPVSIKSFVQWYNDYIISKDIEKITIKQFLHSCVTDLVSLNLTNKILEGSKVLSLNIKDEAIVIDDNVRVGDKTVKAYFEDRISNENGSAIVYFDEEEPQNNPFLRVHSKISNFERSISNNERTQLKPKNYLFLFNKTENAELRGDYSEDIIDNIYHFYIGEDRGIVKQITFKTIDNPKVNTAIITGNSSTYSSSRIIPSRYEFEMEMMGNNMFFPNTTVYIAPTIPGTGGMREPLMKAVGLSGYYNIIKVNSKIQSGLYNTTLRGVYTSPASDESSAFMEIDLFEKLGPEGMKKVIEEKNTASGFAAKEKQRLEKERRAREQAARARAKKKKSLEKSVAGIPTTSKEIADKAPKNVEQRKVGEYTIMVIGSSG